MTSRRALILIIAELAGCSAAHEGPSRDVQLRAGAVAVVGDEIIDGHTVASIASAQGVTKPAALEAAIADAVVSAAAKERLGGAATRRARSSALGRALVEALQDEAQNQGPPTDDEVAKATDKRRWELDRPALRRVTHAVVRVKNPADDARARSVAEHISQSVAAISDKTKFREAASAVPAEGLEVLVQDLDPITPEGVALNMDGPEPSMRGEFVRPFADAVFAVPAVGQTSPVVKTEFGYHVILVVETIPEHRLSLEERRKVLGVEIVRGRASVLLDAALAHARSLEPVVIERSAVDSMLQVRAAP